MLCQCAAEGDLLSTTRSAAAGDLKQFFKPGKNPLCLEAYLGNSGFQILAGSCTAYVCICVHIYISDQPKPTKSGFKHILQYKGVNKENN